jgi:hypothetical protein
MPLQHACVLDAELCNNTDHGVIHFGAWPSPHVLLQVLIVLGQISFMSTLCRSHVQRTDGNLLPVLNMALINTPVTCQRDDELCYNIRICSWIITATMSIKYFWLLDVP